MRFIAQMLGKFSAQHPFHQPDLQLLHQAFVAEQILGSIEVPLDL